MRVSGYGSSFSGDASGRDRDRSGRFRRSHRAGQKVRGTVLEWRGPGLAWVDIDGHGLLAQISTDASLGRERTFLIVSLHPAVILKELPDNPQGLNVIV